MLERNNISFTYCKQDYNLSSGYRWKFSLKKPCKVCVWTVLPHVATRDHELEFKTYGNKKVLEKTKGAQKNIRGQKFVLLGSPDSFNQWCTVYGLQLATKRQRKE